MKLETKRLLPENPRIYDGFRAVRMISAFYLFVVVVRSTIHLVASDGGANSIAGIDISLAGGNNIIAIFHQWGATQLLLALFQFLLFFRYPGFTPLILVTLAMDPIMRAIAGQFKALETDTPPPGESLNWVAFSFVVVLLIASLMNRSANRN